MYSGWEAAGLGLLTSCFAIASAYLIGRNVGERAVRREAERLSAPRPTVGPKGGTGCPPNPLCLRCLGGQMRRCAGLPWATEELPPC